MTLYFSVTFRKMTLAKLSLLVFSSGVWLAFLGSWLGFCKRQRGRRTPHRKKSSWLLSAPEYLLCLGDTGLGNAAHVVLHPREAAFQDCPWTLLFHSLTNNIGGCMGEWLVQWEMEAFRTWVIFKRPCGQNNSSLADSSKCCLGFPSHMEGLFSDTWVKVLGQQCMAIQC